MKYFLDTNICVYYLKGMYPGIVENLLSKNPEDIKIPSIVKAELLYGAEKSQTKDKTREKIYEFLLPFEIVGFNDAAAERFGKMREYLEKKGMIIGPNDLILASTVLSFNGTLITNNVKEFKRIKELKIENWLE
ncbi:MAG: type II toxin-antitoxin system VapC family toxin [Spirochaetia bacterium]|jgi:tRNA(fMet)-specific endonuclease VapC|nr:type II toxin-antitoxin system VapC family toxin [Spirochaetia bacterium]